MDTTNKAPFDPLKYGAKPVSGSGGFDPLKMGAIPVSKLQEGQAAISETPNMLQQVAGDIVAPFENISAAILNKTTQGATGLARMFNKEAQPAMPKVTKGVFGTELKELKTLQDVAGEAIKAGATVYGGGKVAQTGVGGLFKRNLPKIAQMAKEGAVGLGAFELGEQVQKSQEQGYSPVEGAKDIVGATALGGALGPVIGGGAALAGKALRGAKDIVVEQAQKLVDPVTAYTKSAVKNINKAIPITRMVKPEQLKPTQDKAFRALNVISDNAPNVKIFDEDIGQDVAFNPLESNFLTTNEALVQTKRNLWKNLENTMKTKGVNLTVDINTPYKSESGKVMPSLYDQLEEVIKDTSNLPEKRATAKELIDLFTENADVNGKIPVTAFQNINTQMYGKAKAGYGNSTALGTKTYKQFAEESSRLLDNVFDSIDAPEIRQLKDDYSALKSVENYIVNEAKKEMRQLDNRLSSMMGDIGTSEMLSGVMSAVRGDIVPLVKGGLLRGLSEMRKRAGDRSNFLRRAFEDIDKIKANKVVPETQNPSSVSVNQSQNISKIFQRNKEATYSANKATTPTTIPSAIDTTSINSTLPSKEQGVNLPGQKSAYGGVAGIETDEEGNVSFSPEKAALGMLGMGAMTSRGGEKMQAKVFEGFKDLTLKTLDKLKGKSVVSKQFISDLTNSGDIKQVERDLLRQALETEGDKVNVVNFAEKVKAELLPLKVSKARDMYTTARGGTGGRYESVTLPDDIRGSVKNYEERIYESPIKTSAGNVHFGQPKDKVEGYFGHTRIEDMADNKTRRVIEVQSDLYQKGNLETLTKVKGMPGDMNTIVAFEKFATMGERNGKTSQEIYQGLKTANPAMMKELGVNSLEGFRKSLDDAREIVKQSKEYKKLAQYNDPTAHFRMIREEIKKAAEDGKTKLQFPTGETAMKIEGLGDNNQFWNTANRGADMVRPEQLEVGKKLYTNGDSWIITDVLGDGKFKAVVKHQWDSYNPQGETPNQNMINSLAEQFDISGTVDTENPIYKFYEKEVQRYLNNNFGGKRIVDENGVSWVEVPVTKEMGQSAVKAFGMGGLAALGLGATQSEKAKADTGEKRLDTMPKEYKNSEKVKTDTGGTTDAYTKESERYKYLKPFVENVENKIKEEYGEGLPKGMLMAILMKESSLGANTSSYNKKLGENAWLVGFTDSAKSELKKKGKEVNTDTIEGVLEAAARYLMEKKIMKKVDGKVIDLSTVPDKWYRDRYYGMSHTEKEREEARSKIKALIEYYK